ncbi:MAG TPA: efflux RND transporter permease subunit, partial [Thermoanaerobaculia bacterium]|nr:efflux RND transporter permease subunit [Thermoanaerobaculia bacterium]
QGVDGRFLRPLALAFVLAVLASLLVAFTVTPALCALLLPEGGGPRPARWLEGLKRGHGRLLGWVERAFWPCLLALFLLLAAASAWLPFLGSELMPAFREGHFVLQVSSRAPGTSLAEMLALGERISQDVLALPFVATIEQQVGRAELGEDTWGPHRSEFHVELKADAQVDQQEAQEELRRVLANYPAARSEVMTFLGDRISESLTGETAQVVVNLFGERLDELDRSGQAVAAALEGTPGIVELQLKRESGAPQLAVELDPRALATYGVSAGEVLEAVAMANAGLEVGETFDGARTVPVVVIEPPERRSSLSGLESLPIATPAGPVPLARLATLAPRAGRFTLQHE